MIKSFNFRKHKLKVKQYIFSHKRTQQNVIRVIRNIKTRN